MKNTISICIIYLIIYICVYILHVGTVLTSEVFLQNMSMRKHCITVYDTYIIINFVYACGIFLAYCLSNAR